MFIFISLFSLIQMRMLSMSGIIASNCIWLHRVYWRITSSNKMSIVSQCNVKVYANSKKSDEVKIKLYTQTVLHTMKLNWGRLHFAKKKSSTHNKFLTFLSFQPNMLNNQSVSGFKGRENHVRSPLFRVKLTRNGVSDRVLNILHIFLHNRYQFQMCVLYHISWNSNFSSFPNE